MLTLIVKPHHQDEIDEADEDEIKNNPRFKYGTIWQIHPSKLLDSTKMPKLKWVKKGQVVSAFFARAKEQDVEQALHLAQMFAGKAPAAP